jgi:hypothetical protein
MENFGERLSVDDIWRVVLFVKTIPNHTLRKGVIPEPRDYIAWSPSKELLAWVKSKQRLDRNIAFAKKQSSDPFIEEARRVFPGLGPADQIVVKGLGTDLTLRDAANGIRALYGGMLNSAWADARRRGDKLPAISQKAIPPTVPGQQ